MLLSINFLKDYLDLDDNIDVKEIAEKMTKVGNEYDSASKFINATKLTIGKVIECEKHPDSDHLHICKVDVGNGKILNIVCGAPNVKKGIKVIVALDGATLPKGIIKKGSIRGQVSEGMLCSIAELGLDEKFLKEEDKTGICILGDDAKIGDDPIKYLGYDDSVIDFELTANRGDLLSIIGMAYEIGAIYDKKVKGIDLSHKNFDKNLNEINEVSSKIDLKNEELTNEIIKENDKANEKENEYDLKLDINTDNCSLFLARKVSNVEIKESPIEIKERLMASGIRPINNVVDISNYVMLETGQPLHFYDADKLGNTIEVRMAKENEKLTTLDKKERVLSNEDIVISNGKEAIGLAGVMGGYDTEITNETKNVIIESAIFDNVKIRRTSNKVLRSEASNRFEKGLDPNRTYMAIERACHLLEKYASGKVILGLKSYDKTNKGSKKIEITEENINNILGTKISKEDILDSFRKLDFKCETQKDSSKIIVNVPHRRLDISIKEDLIEEVGRIYGVDNIEGKNMVLPIRKGTYDKLKRNIRNKMVDLGLNETLSYVLVNEKEADMFTLKNKESIKILAPLTEEKSVLRQTIVTSLYKIYEYNKARKNDDISIFEIGKSFYQEKDNSNEIKYLEENKLACLMSGKYLLGLDSKKVDFYIIKGIAEEILDYLGYSGRYSFVQDFDKISSDMHKGKSAIISVNNDNVGFIGRISPIIAKDEVYVMEINLDKLLLKKTGNMKFKEISKFPVVKKDLAFVVDKNINAQDMQKIIKSSGGKLLINSEVFDLYTGKGIDEGKKSIAFTIEIGDKEKTLTDEEINQEMNKIIDGVKNKFKAELRN